MDADKKCCNVIDYVKCKKLEILGLAMVLLASIATLLSFSGLGLLGMLLVGWGFIFRRCFKCRCGCCCHNSCESSMCNEMEVCSDVKPAKKTSTKTKKA
jgi:hypothetical protein